MHSLEVIVAINEAVNKNPALARKGLNLNWDRPKKVANGLGSGFGQSAIQKGPDIDISPPQPAADK